MKCENDAILVPLDEAAQGVGIADIFAAIRVITGWSRVLTEAAFVRIGAELEVDTQLFRPVCAELVPEHLATERIDAADGVAARGVLASRGILGGGWSGLCAGSPIWRELHRDRATRDRDATSVVGQRSAKFIPCGFATECLVATDQLAACGVATIRGGILERAVSCAVGSAAESVGILDRHGALAAKGIGGQVGTRDEDALDRCEIDAVDIPLFLAAGWIEPADQGCAVRVFASATEMNRETGAQS